MFTSVLFKKGIRSVTINVGELYGAIAVGYDPSANQALFLTSFTKKTYKLGLPNIGKQVSYGRLIEMIKDNSIWPKNIRQIAIQDRSTNLSWFVWGHL